MPKLICLLCLLLVGSHYRVKAQVFPEPVTRTCGTHTVNQQLSKTNPQAAPRLERVKQAAAEFMQLQGRARITQPVIQIPVVFHILYHRDEENIPDAQILSQLEVLNQDYRRRNPDTANTLPAFKKIAADTRIQFCLATIDPNGQPTTGITRTYTDSLGFATDDGMKFSAKGGRNAWNATKYLNIWVCNLKNQFLGYAQFPGGDANIDGVVLLYKAIGKYPVNPYANFAFNQGRTATHEVGHWLGLDHVWGPKDSGCEDSDGIADTPNQDKANTGCRTGTVTSCNNAELGGDMYQNYLDYTHDACMNLFTQGQATYMNAVIGSSRPGLLTAVVCERPLRADFSASDTIVVTGATMQFNDNSIGVRATNWQWTFEGGFPATSSLQNPVVQFTQPGRYAVTLTVSNGTLSDTRIKTSYIFVTYGEPRVYPNPAQDFVIIDLPADYEVKTIVLLNALGQPVRSGIPKNATLRMSLAGLANGIYYVRVMQKNGPVAIKKVLVLKE